MCRERKTRDEAPWRTCCLPSPCYAFWVWNSIDDLVVPRIDFQRRFRRRAAKLTKARTVRAIELGSGTAAAPVSTHRVKGFAEAVEVAQIHRPIKCGIAFGESRARIEVV